MSGTELEWSLAPGLHKGPPVPLQCGATFVPTEVDRREGRADPLLNLQYPLVGVGSDPDWAEHVQSFPAVGVALATRMAADGAGAIRQPNVAG